MSPYVKSILAFLALVLTNVATQLTTTGTAWPTDGGEWVRFAVTTVLGTWLVYQVPNRTSDPVVAQTQSVQLRGRHEA